MKRKTLLSILILLVCAVPAALRFPAPAYADVGPKPSVRIEFQELPDEPCWGTLLSKEERSGPWTAWEEGDEPHDEEEAPIWTAFASYADADGYHFLKWVSRVDASGRLNWEYLPPSTFKILLYFPESGSYAVSGSLHRYAMHSYYTVAPVSADGGALSASLSYPYASSLEALLWRIVLTILIEIAAAVPFGLSTKRLLLLLIGVNLVTQILLNASLALSSYLNGSFAFVAAYLLLEAAVFGLEAMIYTRWLSPLGRKPVSNGRAIAYAAAANGASFVCGFLMAFWFPAFF